MVGLWMVGGLEPEKRKAGQAAVCLRRLLVVVVVVVVVVVAVVDNRGDSNSDS